MEIAEQTDGEELELFEYQDDELFDEVHRQVWHIGGPGSGKSKINGLHFLRRSAVQTDQLYAIFANTYDQLHNAIIPEIREMLDVAGIDDRFGVPPPAKWRRRWRKLGIRVPKPRKRYHNVWIWENGTHIYCGTLANNAWKRIKSFELAMAIIEEVTEGAPLAAITYIWTRLRCGWNKRETGDTERVSCRARGHNHQLIVKGNVPLNDPGHWIYKHVETLKAKEAERETLGKAPFFRLITSATGQNSRLPEGYLDGLAAALDPETYEQQVSGRLERNIAATTYYQFSEHNVLKALTYDPMRPLHLWFDFNTEPAIAGWGHDLHLDEVPSIYLRAGLPYFGVVGEWFNDYGGMTTDQLAHALCEDPTADQRCVDCGHNTSDDHVTTGDGQLCRVCARFCSGDVMHYQWQRRALHATPNWRGLIQHRAHIYVYGDATGGASHSDASQLGGSIGILRDVFTANIGDRVHFRFKSSNPAIPMRLLSVNRMLGAANGYRGLFFGDWVTGHLDDMREVVPDPKTGHPKKVQGTRQNKQQSDYWKRTHASDGLGYHLDFRWPAVRPRYANVASVGTPEGHHAFGDEDEEV